MRGANVLATNKIDETPLDCATQCSSCYKAIELNVNLINAIPPCIQKTVISKYGFFSRFFLQDFLYDCIFCSDISKGKETNPIECINIVDDEEEPTDYVYVSKNCFTSDIEVDCKVSTMQSCNCDDNRCDGDGCGCGRSSVHCWYDAVGKLTMNFNYSGKLMLLRLQKGV